MQPPVDKAHCPAPAAAPAAPRPLGPGWRALTWAARQYIRLTGWAVRWERRIDPDAQALIAEGKPYIIAFWHGRIMMLVHCRPHHFPVEVMISNNLDGSLIAETVAPLDVIAIRGSSRDPRKPGKHKGGREALKIMLARLEQGAVVAITPDGPRGPRQRAQDGVVTLARMSGAPIVPVTGAVRRGIRFGSWDRFVMPLPFGRGLILWDAPIVLPRDGDPEEMRLLVETRLNALSETADREMGRAPIPPAAPRART